MVDFRLVSAGLAVVCAVLLVVIAGGGAVKTVYVNNTVYPQEGLSVFYLYPLRCVDCDLNKPGQCDYCTSYYDLRLMDLLSQELGVPLEFYVSDAVNKPNVLVAYKGKLTLGDARTRYNIANTLCRFAGVEKSCSLFQNEMDRVEECIGGYGVEAGEVVYHTSSRDCPMCPKTDKVVGELEKLEYENGIGYKVSRVDHSDGQQRKLITDCMQAFDNTDYVPQLLCPRTGWDLTGDFTLSQAREFADQCIEAGG